MNFDEFTKRFSEKVGKKDTISLQLLEITTILFHLIWILYNNNQETLSTRDVEKLLK